MNFKKLKALFYLGWHFFMHFIKKLPFFSSRLRGKKAFLSHYKNDHIFPISANERINMPNFHSCYNCRICDTVCPQFDSTDSLSSPSYLVTGYSRSLTDYFHLKTIPLDCQECNACESACPENVPIKEIISFVKNHVELNIT